MKTTTDKAILREMFPARVLAPELTGEYYILQHHTHHEQNHMIVARSREALVHTFGRVEENEAPDAIKEFCRIEIVAPTLELRNQYAENLWESEIRDFWSDMQFSLTWCGASGNFRKSGKLPPQLKWCACAKQHSDCNNCHMGLKPKEGTLESFYWSARTKYLTSKGRQEELESKPELIKARDLMPGESISMLEYAPGHHSSGMTLVRGGYFNSYAAAFCVVKEELPYEFYNSMIKFKAQEATARRKEEQSKHVVKRRNMYTEERKKAFDFFASL